MNNIALSTITLPGTPAGRNEQLVADAARLTDLRHRVLRELRTQPAAGRTALDILALNWARGLAADRGFTPRKRIHAHDAMPLHRLGLLQPLASLARGGWLKRRLPNSTLAGADLAWADEKLTLWARVARARVLAAWFEQLVAAGAPHTVRQSALTHAAEATPHGAKSNALAHGQRCKVYLDAILHLLAGSPTQFRVPGNPRQLRVPAWVSENAGSLLERFKALEPLRGSGGLPVGSGSIYAGPAVSRYLVNHDVGKAFCASLDEAGRVHFPGHAEASAKRWAQAGGAALECELMSKDMCMHLCTAAEVEVLAKDSVAPVLLLAVFAEIHANAEDVFGGFDSDSFKIKLKHLDRRGRALLAQWTKDGHEPV